MVPSAVRRARRSARSREPSIFGLTDGLKMRDRLSRANEREHGRFFLEPILGDDQRNGLPDHLRGGVAEHLFGPAVPCLDDAVEILADDGIVGGRDDGRETGIRILYGHRSDIVARDASPNKGPEVGSRISVQHPRAAPRLGVSPPLILPKQRKAYEQTDSATLEGFRIGSVQSGPVPAGVADLSYLEGVRIDGIVGLDVLARTSFSIDYRTRVVRFGPEGRENAVAPLEKRVAVCDGEDDHRRRAGPIAGRHRQQRPGALQDADARRALGRALERRQDSAVWVGHGALAAAGIATRRSRGPRPGTHWRPGCSIACRTDTRRASTVSSG